MLYLADMMLNPGQDQMYPTNSLVTNQIPYKLGKDLKIDCECGFTLAVTPMLTDLYCPNPYCPVKNTYKVLKVFEKTHQKMNIGPSIAKTFVHNINALRHMDVICIDSTDQMPPQYSLERRQNWLEALRSLRTNVKFSEFVEYFQIDGLGATRCTYSFANISNTDELIDQIVNHTFSFREHLAKANGFASAYNDACTSLYDTIVRYTPLFKSYEQYFTFEKSSGELMYISMTGSFSMFSPRASFYPWLAENYYINAQEIKRFSKKTDILLYEEDSKSSQRVKADKAGKAMHINDFIASIEPLRRETNDREG